MQITGIQNIIRNNFQYKNNPIKFKAKYNFNSQEGDIVELSQKIGVKEDDIAVSRKYHRGEQEFKPETLLIRKDRIFIKNKGSYIPYGAHLDEYNAKGDLIRHTSYNNGYKYLVDTYKNGQIVQEDRYEDVFGYFPNKKTTVRKFNDLNKTQTAYKVPFSISRNYGKSWKNSPEIEMTKGNLGIKFKVPSDENIGLISVINFDFMQTNCIYLYEDDVQKEYITDPNLMLLGLQELRKTIQSEEFKTDFGFNQELNSELDKAINFLSSKLNAN